MDAKSYGIIINPISGSGSKKKIESLLMGLSQTNRRIELMYTQYAGHATELARNASERFDVVVVVGGDGSVNEVAQGLIGHKACMGILPSGSGNGLARHLGISMSPNKAIEQLFISAVKPIDLIRIGEKYSANVSGIGFDAKVAQLFSEQSTRGLITYVKSTIKAFRTFKAQEYSIEIDGKFHKKDKYFLIGIANSSQFGNNAFISPYSSVTDGMFELIFVAAFPWYYAPVLAYRLFNKTIHRSKYVQIVSSTRARIESDQAFYLQIDGEPIGLRKSIDIELIANALNLLIP